MNQLRKANYSNLYTSFRRYLSTSEARMGVDKQVLRQGDGSTYPQKGQTVTVHYTGRFKSLSSSIIVIE